MMEISNKCLFILGMLLSASIAGTMPNVVLVVEAAGECGQVPPDRMALSLAPCAAAAQNPQAPVSPQCCTQIQRLGQNPKCLCAVMLSNTAKNAGLKPQVAMTIPKRCNLARRPVGYKCGGYTLP